MPAPTATLQAIETKVRRLTRSPSTAQLTEADLQNYINTFVVYDFPEHLRTFNMRTTYTFYTNPGQDRYPTDEVSFAGVTTNPLYNFQNNFISIHAPVYMAGYNSFFTQSREQFFGVYPKTNSIAATGSTGDGIATQFSGVVNTAQSSLVPGQSNQAAGILQFEVLFDSIDSNGNGLTLVDLPVVDTSTGNNTQIGNLYDPNSTLYQAAVITPPTVPFIGPLAPGTGFINYNTGQFNINFTTAPGPARPINSQTVFQVLSLPQALLYYDNTFFVRPLPDQPYRIQFEAYMRPTFLMNLGQTPQLEEWWQYIAYGAAKKIFEDRMDLDSVALILPEYQKQEQLVLRRTIVQNTNERTATIYTEQVGGIGGSGFWGWSGGPFVWIGILITNIGLFWS